MSYASEASKGGHTADTGKVAGKAQADGQEAAAHIYNTNKGSEGRKLNAAGRWRCSDDFESAGVGRRTWRWPAKPPFRYTPSLGGSMSSISVDSEREVWQGSMDSLVSGSSRGSSITTSSGQSSAMAFSSGWSSSSSTGSAQSRTMVAADPDYSFGSSRASSGAGNEGDQTVRALQQVEVGSEEGKRKGFFPYSLKKCPNLLTTHRLPENKLNGDQDAHAHSMLDEFIRDNLPLYLPNYIAQAPDHMSFCLCTYPIWLARLQPLNYNHRVKFTRWSCSQCGYKCPGFWLITLLTGVQIRIKEDACNDCYKGDGYSVVAFAAEQN